jgi:CubicO group peptidase (beta-lactamase class C family)
VTVSGTFTPGFEPLRDLLTRNLADGSDTGASLAVIQDGELVVDLWGGETSPGTPWAEDSMVMVWSVTKPMAALTTLVLADRGDIDLDAPVSDYWKDFRRDDVLVRHLLSHTSGYAGWTETLTFEQLLDLELAAQRLAEQEPWFEPGDGSGYHMICYGHLLDGLVRAATGVPLAEQFRTLVAEPLGSDFHIAVPEADLDRCVDVIAPDMSGVDFSALPPDSMYIRTVVNPLLDVQNGCNSAEFRRAGVAGIGGHGNARAIARAQSVVSHGGEIDGVRLLSAETIDRIFEVQAEGPDRVLFGAPVRWGIGYALPQPVTFPAVPEGRACFWTGWGGSIVINDLDRRTTIAYAMNRMEAAHILRSERTDAYVRTTYECLEGLS